MHDGAFGIAIVVVHGHCRVGSLIILSLVLNKVNVQAPLSEQRFMEDEVPLITVVKKGEIGPKPSLSPESLALEQTLTMLCSFLSLEDFISFLSSPMFQNYAQHEEMWVLLEIGLYVDHTKTLQLYPGHNDLTIADEAMTGAFEEHVWKGQADDTLVAALRRWVAMVSPMGP